MRIHHRAFIHIRSDVDEHGRHAHARRGDVRSIARRRTSRHHTHAVRQSEVARWKCVLVHERQRVAALFQLPQSKTKQDALFYPSIHHPLHSAFFSRANPPLSQCSTEFAECRQCLRGYWRRRGSQAFYGDLQMRQIVNARHTCTRCVSKHSASSVTPVEHRQQWDTARANWHAADRAPLAAPSHDCTARNWNGGAPLCAAQLASFRKRKNPQQQATPPQRAFRSVQPRLPRAAVSTAYRVSSVTKVADRFPQSSPSSTAQLSPEGARIQ